MIEINDNHTMRQVPPSTNKTIEDLFLLGWAGTLFVLIIFSFITNYKKRASNTTKPAPHKLRPIIASEEESKRPNRLKKFRVKTPQIQKDDPDEVNHPAHPITQQEKNESDIIKTKNRRNSQEKTDASPTLFSAAPVLPAQIRFSDEFVYPSPEGGCYQVYPLPGPQKSQPVARVTIGSHSMLIRNTQFGVLTTQNLPDESHIAIHQRCIETGQVAYDSQSRLFKTRPVKTAGDERIYATHKITTEDGLTLHIFDTPIQHAHH